MNFSIAGSFVFSLRAVRVLQGLLRLQLRFLSLRKTAHCSDSGFLFRSFLFFHHVFLSISVCSPVAQLLLTADSGPAGLRGAGALADAVLLDLTGVCLPS